MSIRSIQQKKSHAILIEWIEAVDLVDIGSVQCGRIVEHCTSSNNPLKSYIDTHVSNGFLIITEPDISVYDPDPASEKSEEDIEPVAIPVSHIVTLTLALEDEE